MGSFYSEESATSRTNVSSTTFLNDFDPVDANVTNNHANEKTHHDTVGNFCSNQASSRTVLGDHLKYNRMFDKDFVHENTTDSGFVDLNVERVLASCESGPGTEMSVDVCCFVFNLRSVEGIALVINKTRQSKVGAPLQAQKVQGLIAILRIASVEIPKLSECKKINERRSEVLKNPFILRRTSKTPKLVNFFSKSHSVEKLENGPFRFDKRLFGS